MSQLYRHFHFLSLDIVLGAMASSVLAARLFESQPGWAWWICLSLTVWLLYTGDHMLDAWRHRKKVEREMHHFMLRHKRNLIWFMGILAVVNMMLIINLLDKNALKYALVLAALVLLFYAFRHIFRRNRRFLIPGEFFILLIYLAGTWLGPVAAAWPGNASSVANLERGQALIAIMFAGVLLMNLGVISLYDIQLDTRLGLSSLARNLGPKATRNMLIGTAVVILLLAVLQFTILLSGRYTQFALIMAGMAFLLLIVLLMPSWFRRNDLYRWTADAVLYLGFLSLLVG